MDVLNEAKEIMEKAGCTNVYATYNLNISEIAEFKNCNKNCEFIEAKRTINHLDPAIVKVLEIDREKPIECPLNSSMDKYLEFSLKNKSITTYSLGKKECERIKQEISPLLEKYHWSMKKG
jgi:hypothetical protein